MPAQNCGILVDEVDEPPGRQEIPCRLDHLALADKKTKLMERLESLDLRDAFDPRDRAARFADQAANTEVLVVVRNR